jgi:serine/threonine-protein kinase
MVSVADGSISGRGSGLESGETLAVPLRIGRYELFDRIAAGGMATVYFGRLVSGAGFRRAVALKRLHPHLAEEKRFVAMLRDEARLAGRIRHPNVVPVLDVVEGDGELLLVLELVEGPSLGTIMTSLRERNVPMPLEILSGIMRGALAGLDAAHEAKDESGQPLNLVHRDISPQNVLVGIDGVARVADFGIAKARGRIHTTDDGRLKGNFAYMAPEQAKRKPVTPRTDLYAAGLLLWEGITGRRMHGDDEPAAILTKMLYEEPAAVTDFRDVPAEVEALVRRALAKEPDDRFANALEMSDALGRAFGTASAGEIARFLAKELPSELARLRARIERVETSEEMGGTTDRRRLADDDKARDASSEGGGRVTAVVRDLSIPPPPAKGRTKWLAYSALVALAMAGGVVAAALSRGTPREVIPPATAVTSPPAVTSPVRQAAVAPPPTQSVVSETPPPEPIASATPSATASASSETTKTPRTPNLRPPTVRPPTAQGSRPSTGPNPSSGTTTQPPASATSPSTTPAAPKGLEGIPRERE